MKKRNLKYFQFINCSIYSVLWPGAFDFSYYFLLFSLYFLMFQLILLCICSYNLCLSSFSTYYVILHYIAVPFRLSRHLSNPILCHLFFTWFLEKYIHIIKIKQTKCIRPSNRRFINFLKKAPFYLWHKCKFLCTKLLKVWKIFTVIFSFAFL